MTTFQPTSGIYALVHPDTGRAMYIGQSIDIDYRYRQHCDYLSADYNLKLKECIAELRRNDQQAKVLVLENRQNASELDEAEREWIRHFRARGEAEFNISTGGSSAAVSKIMNTTREEWFQFARKVRTARALLSEISEDMARLAPVIHCDVVMKLMLKFDKEIEGIERRVRSEFPDWDDLSEALWTKNDRQT
mgnify:CR=1 FL=1